MVYIEVKGNKGNMLFTFGKNDVSYEKMAILVKWICIDEKYIKVSKYPKMPYFKTHRFKCLRKRIYPVNIN